MEEGKFDSNEMKDNIDPSPSTVEKVKLPKIGIIFSSEEEVHTFYNSYATNAGFGISKLGGRNGDDGKQKYFSIGCAKNHKKVSQAKNVLHPQPSSKTNCKAKINVAVRNDGNFVITSVDLEHNHLLSPGKSRHFRCNKVLDSSTKRKLELNDQAGITLSKSFHSCVVEAGGYENLSFDERKCRNYISEARRLRLGEGDAEALIILGHSIERQFQNAYTNNIFKLFQDEIRGLMFCDASLLREEGTTLIFEVVENMLGNNGHPGREVSFRVHYTELDCQLKCVCRLFEFRGILCRHVIKVLMRMKVIEVPMRYIMDRWRKDIKRGYQSISNIYDDYGCDGKRLRYNTLTPLMQEVQQLGAENDDICSVLVKIMKDTKEKLIIAMENGQSMVEQLEEASTSGAKVIHSPLKVRTKGAIQKEIAEKLQNAHPCGFKPQHKPQLSVLQFHAFYAFEYIFLIFVIHYIRSDSLRICSGHAGCDGQYSTQNYCSLLLLLLRTLRETSLTEEEQLLLQRRGRRGCDALEEVRAGEGEEKTAGEGAVAASARGKKGQNLFEGVGAGEGAVAASARGEKGLRRFRRS
ncbi:hypothetical protein ZIOFF_029056 [Zingiber officinale]|uniref:SWIM-type domain-containing protein n=1 Tax=Zingiber officinale TaxID=94328 RepID=A0A8J5GM52_ZINOF|nr:hypothetical protein ZIOFF_029056 [Zingiber officinale]